MFTESKGFEYSTLSLAFGKVSTVLKIAFVGCLGFSIFPLRRGSPKIFKTSSSDMPDSILWKFCFE